jgi:hypothetical protein
LFGENNEYLIEGEALFESLFIKDLLYKIKVKEYVRKFEAGHINVYENDFAIHMEYLDYDRNNNMSIAGM